MCEVTLSLLVTSYCKYAKTNTCSKVVVVVVVSFISAPSK